MGDRRRTIQQPSQPPIVPSSIPRPSNASLRQSLAPSNNRTSLLPPSTQARQSTSRQSIAPYSTYDQGGGSQSQPFSQGHGGIGGQQPPMTASRLGHMYTSQQHSNLGTMSVARNQHLLTSSRGSIAPNQQNIYDYVPPSYVSSLRCSVWTSH